MRYEEAQTRLWLRLHYFSVFDFFNGWIILGMKMNQIFYAVIVKTPVIFRQILYFFDHLFILEKIHNLSIFSLMTFCFCFGGWCREAALCKIGFWSLYEMYSISEGTLSINQHFFTLWKSALPLKSMSLLNNTRESNYKLHFVR